MKRILLSVSVILSAVFSCSLFSPSLYNNDGILMSGDCICDSLSFTESGGYSIYFSSDYPLDLFFFETKEGMSLFEDSGLLYSELIFQPLSYSDTAFIDEQFYVFEENKKIYFVIDNRDFAGASKGNANYSIDIKKL